MPVLSSVSVFNSRLRDELNRVAVDVVVIVVHAVGSFYVLLEV